MEVAELTPIGEPTGIPPVVLVLEDEPPDACLLEEAFRERRVAVRFVVATSLPRLREALRLLHAEAPPRLIIVDLGPRRPGGYDLRALAADPLLRRVPKVVLSGGEREQERAASFAAGAVEHLIKAGDFDGFLAIADRLQAYLVAGMTERA